MTSSWIVLIIEVYRAGGRVAFTIKTPGSNMIRKRVQFGVRLNLMTRKLFNLPRNMHQTWVNLISFCVKSAER